MAQENPTWGQARVASELSVNGDIFREVREDGSEAEELKFTRDASGKVTGYIQSSNPKLRMPPIERP